MIAQFMPFRNSLPRYRRMLLQSAPQHEKCSMRLVLFQDFQNPVRIGRIWPVVKGQRHHLLPDIHSVHNVSEKLETPCLDKLFECDGKPDCRRESYNPIEHRHDLFRRFSAQILSCT